jgi:chemotaxis protein CheD
VSVAPAVARAPGLSDAPAAKPGRRLVVGIGEFAVSNQPGDLIITHALGSCVAICLFDPIADVAGLIHILLPESRINPTRAAEQPAAFADSGIPLLFQAAYKLGAEKKRCVVHLIGGAEITAVKDGNGAFNIGRRNILAAKNALWRNGVLIKGESVGGTIVRTVDLAVGDGRIQVRSGRDTLVNL